MPSQKALLLAALALLLGMVGGATLSLLCAQDPIALESAERAPAPDPFQSSITLPALPMPSSACEHCPRLSFSF